MKLTGPFVLIVGLAATSLLLAGGTARAADDDLVCGEARVISATIRDAGGNPVSDHTRVVFVTNFGGVLAGTGATLDPLASGYVAPLSSTTAETSNGVATVTLITSTDNAGPYEVVVSSGGSVYATQMPQPAIYAPGGTAPNVSAVIPQLRYQLAYVPSGPVIAAQVTVTCKAP